MERYQYFLPSPELSTQTWQKYVLENKVKTVFSLLGCFFRVRIPGECPSCSECSAFQLNLVLFSVSKMDISSKFSLQTSVCFVELFGSFFCSLPQKSLLD